MKRYITPSALTMILFILTAAGIPTLYAAEPNDVMHPEISLLDEKGNILTGESGKISTVRTCGRCHDTRYINNHNNHFTDNVRAGCIVCHFKEGLMDGDYREAHLRIQLPANENCALCHGLVQVCSEPLFIPADYARTLVYREGQRYYDITQRTGVILAPRDLSASSLNLRNKEDLHFPWDVHSRRQLDCIACHFIGNDPRYCGNTRAPLDHLTRDPRKIKSPGEILKRPDHNLKIASCTCCHDPFKVHKNLPYKKRHMEVLNCQSCHVPEIYGPALQTVDRTVVAVGGGGRIQFRGVDESKNHGTAVSTKYFAGYRPFLFPHKDTGNTYKISPFNLVTHWYWISRKTGQPVPPPILQKVYLNDSFPPNAYTADVLKVFDKNGNQTVDSEELVLDSDEKIALIREKLEAAGIDEPGIAGTINAHRVDHGVVEALHMKRDCSACHAPGSKFGKDVLLAVYAPAGARPEFSPGILPIINGGVTIAENGNVILERTSSVSGHYIFGHGRVRSWDRVGIWLFILALLGIFIHGISRYAASLKHPPHRPKTRRVYMYRFYERLWHWTMAAAVMVLVLTGLEIHYSGGFTIFGLQYAVSIHNILAAILVVNGVFSFFYHLTTGEIKQFFGFNRKFTQQALVQLYYYIQDMFKGTPHPLPKTVERKLNPLQQLTYIGLLNILLPFQAITGILIWGAEKWPLVSQKLGGLTYLAPIHNLGSWFFLSFLAVHIYLTTTGASVFSNIRAMVTGYDEVAEDEPHEKHRRLMEMKLRELMGTVLKKIKRKKNHPPVEENNE